ncbi:RNA polymerase ECF family sigma subunit [Herbihabitans rhizosphaerae]|uniref:RNA polymerase sigma factor n=1 Tax=Herbihabitans rhizosphaerae TaxID=1872711 RepID=A0A4Q7KKQ9_9PSEU|nr:sigma-70 family RNA polymerase sigma factor [Herbihabitans rhizosphaerae]RZS36470.1 RNA polymerase ECF family sigma subunit [Herbihabitans rhizosphaerae]
MRGTAVVEKTAETITGKPATEDFGKLADPFRRELLAHCYRMLGSVHDAEDLVQETYLRAWRAYENFEGRSSLRTWLYRIATTACLTALEGRNRRPLPSGLGSSSAEPETPLEVRGEVPWLEPIPDSMLGDPSDPASIVSSRESIRLALVAALQHLPARQRAVLVLRDVLRWKAAEVADALEITTAAVNSMLQRARAQLQQVQPTEETVDQEVTAEQRDLLSKYQAAFENYEFDKLVEMFTSDAVFEMPPFPFWYSGPVDIVRLIKFACPAKSAGDLRLVPTVANGQPAFGMYLRDEHGVHNKFGIQVVELGDGGVAHTVVFFEQSLFDKFGLPDTLPTAG